MIRNFFNKHHYYFKVNTNLIPIKAAGFIHAFGLGAMYSYLSIQARSLGLTASQIGLILSILPIAVLLGPPIFSPLADKLQKHKIFMIIFMLLAAGFHVALIAVPKIPLSAQHNSNLTNFTGDYEELMEEKPRYHHRHNQNYSNHEHNQTFTMQMQENGINIRNGTRITYTGAVLETMVIYAIIRLVAQTCGAISHTLNDAITFGLINKYGGKHNQRLGINRFWHVVGSSLGAPIAGLLMDHFSKDDRKSRNFLPGFIINASAALLAAVIMTFMEVTVEVKPKKVLKNIGGLLKKPPFTVFLFAVFISGKLPCTVNENLLVIFISISTKVRNGAIVTDKISF